MRDGDGRGATVPPALSGGREGRSQTLNRTKQWTCGIAAACLALGAQNAFAVKTSTWTTDEVGEFLRGDATSVTIESDGRLGLGLSADTLVGNLEGVTYIWSLARTAKGTLYFGTGDNGTIYRLVPGGRPAPLWATGAGEITALALDARENLYAGSSPGGVVFRVGAGGDTTRYFETGEESVWSLHVGADGLLYVGTGSKGKVFRVTGPAKGTLFAETRDVNVLSLAETRDGAVLAGTASKGLLWRIEKSGSKRVIYDANADEVRAIAVLSDGSIAVGVNRTGGGSGGGGAPAGGAGGGKGSSGGNPYAVEVTPSGGGGAGGARCAVALVQADGSARLLYVPPCQYLYALVPASASTVLAATGEPAALFQVGLDRKFSLLFAPEAKQVVSVIHSGAGIFAATGNAATISQLGPGAARSGTYLSEAKDLGSVAKWGRVSARTSGGGDILFASRSGLGETPDDGWSEWSKERSLRDQPLIESPPARYLQYRLRFTSGGREGPSLSSIEAAYMQENLPPEILNIRVYGPSAPFTEGPADFRPPQLSQVFPDGLKLDYSFQRSGPRQSSDAGAGWVRGVRSVVWEARDPNDDDLSYKVSIKAEDEKEWHPLGDPTPERGMSWDSQSFANGTYRIRVQAKDDPDNPEASALEAEQVSAPFEIDNLPPRIDALTVEKKAGGRGIAVRGTAVDGDSHVGRIEYSVDGKDWMQVFPTDGIFDSAREEFRFEVSGLAPGEHTITVRASDTERNVAVGKAVTVTP